MALCGVLAWGYQVADSHARLAILGFWGLLMISMLGSIWQSAGSSPPITWLSSNGTSRLRKN